MTFEPFENRLAKRYKHLAKFAQRFPTNAFRAYDRDMPEFPYLVDQYNDAVYVQEFLSRKRKKSPDVKSVIDVISRVLEVPEGRIVYGVRKRGDGAARYAEGFDSVVTTTAFEGDHSFEIRIGEHVDTGLFCDHRLLRRKLAQDADAKTRALNLFAYTGSFSVHLAGAGANVTTVDLSNTYLDWAKRNFVLNDIDPQQHRFERSDVTRFLSQELDSENRYDVIVLDPPSYSKSKKMKTDFDVQRDHAPLIIQGMRLLKPDGVLYFSNNLRSFELESNKLRSLEVSEITETTRSEDFPNNSHRAWEIRRAERQ